jgi:hypothetical protein
MVSVIFGDQLQDVSGDDDELRDFLSAAPAAPPQMAPNPAAARFRAQRDGELQEPDELDGLDPEEFEEDPEPFESRRTGVGRLLGAAKGSGTAKPAKGRRPSAAIQKDVRAKTALLLSIPTTVWEARDPYCGAAAMEAVPDVSEALADIFCDSPEIVAWFTTSGSFVKWLKLAAALKEVAITIVQHHITHSIGDDEDQDETSDTWAGYVA